MSAEGVRGGPQHIPRPPGTRIGDPAPWIDLPPEARRPTLARIRAVLTDRLSPTEPPADRLSAPGAAVLAPLYEHDGDVWVILTRRSWNMRSHTGEISFPGGRREGDEDLWTTATRESQEEIGLDPDLVEPIGELDHLATISSRSSIVPYVGVLPDGRPDLVAAPAEVDAILHVPLAELLDPDIYHEEWWTIAGTERVLHFFELADDTLWGATARMLVDLLGRITGIASPES